MSEHTEPDMTLNPASVGWELLHDDDGTTRRDRAALSVWTTGADGTPYRVRVPMTPDQIAFVARHAPVELVGRSAGSDARGAALYDPAEDGYDEENNVHSWVVRETRARLVAMEVDSAHGSVRRSMAQVKLTDMDGGGWVFFLPADHLADVAALLTDLGDRGAQSPPIAFGSVLADPWLTGPPPSAN